MSASEVEVLYETVINDVVSQMREAFLDEGVDLDVLQQLKADWRAKVVASDCVDLDHKNVTGGRGKRDPASSATASRVPTHMQRQQVIQNRQYPGGPSTNQPPVSRIMTNQQQQQQQLSVVHQQQQLQQQQQHFSAEHLAGAVQQASAGAVMHAQLVTGERVMLMPQSSYGGMQMPNIPVKPTATIVKKLPPQLDGAADDDDEDLPCSSSKLSDRNIATTSTSKPSTSVVDRPSSSSTVNSCKPGKSSGKKAQFVFVSQLDGHSDSSDNDGEGDEEGFEDEDVQKLMHRIGAKSMDASVAPATPIEEEPLNSDDDPSDDEDVETMFEVDNVVVCQFEKVNRIRNRWKFVLKDGIMHLDSRDHCFSKCTGEAEW